MSLNSKDSEEMKEMNYKENEEPKEKEEESKEESKETNVVEESKEEDPNVVEEPKQSKDTVIELRLGDVIKISSPNNEKLNDQTFFIDYIDKSKMLLINTDTLENTKIKIDAEGNIGDGTIVKLAILSRSKELGYARQNELLLDKWIDIHFGGEYPAIITGEITNLENDMIEISTIDKDILYINFDYKGLPEDLPITLIEIREKPQKPVSEDQDQDQELDQVEEPSPILANRGPPQTIQIGIPLKNIKDQLREFILKADQIKFGDEDLGVISQFVDVSSKSQRYSIETQVTDLLDDMLSRIPNAQRTQKVLNNIHCMIERFKQLREHFSFFDEYGNIEGILLNESNYKPLWEYFKNFKQKLYWILPVVKNIKKVYNTGENVEDLENSDIINLDIDQDIRDINNIVDNYKSNTLPNDQNKYSNLYTELNPYFTPFELINEENTANILTERNVQSDLDVIIDNLDGMYSSIFTNNNVKTRRFVIQKYNLGLQKMEIDSTGKTVVSTRVKLTNPDTMSIKSFITLPEPAIKFSKISLPGTSLLEKANLNTVFLNYWEFLKKKTNVNNIFVDTLNNDINYNENNFVNNIKNYVLNLSEEEKAGLTNNEIYSQFIKTIIPKTKVLFELMKKYILGKLSIVDVVGYLEPFLIYSDSLTYQQYVEITKFISEKISENNKRFGERARLFSSLKRNYTGALVFSKAFSIFSIIKENDNLREQIFDEYDIHYDKEFIFSNSEVLRKLILKDYNKLYSTGLSLQNVPLMFPSEFTGLFEDEKKEIDNKMKTAEEKDKCKTMIIAKLYVSLDELNNDNDRDIYFDKKYDKTNYSILDEYEKDMMKMTPENFILHLTNELMKKHKLTEEDAEYLADTLISGYKRVVNGQYAFLYKHDSRSENTHDERDYYIRKDKKWVLDTTVDKSIYTDESSILCNLQEKCINVTDKIEDDKCESIEVDELSIQNKVLKDVIGEFDTKYRISKDEFQKSIQEKFDYFLSIMGVLSKIETNNLMKYNNQKYKLGANTEDENATNIPISPYFKLRDLILGQQDFVKKQNDIIRFVNTYTRPAIMNGFGPLNERESENWLYCIKTNIKLLPVFKFSMATAYITNPDGYAGFIDLLISKIGKQSVDGDWWVDEGSGWGIVKIDSDTEEGFEDGFKVSTRSLLEADIGNSIITADKKPLKIETVESKTISNVVNSLSVSMGINIENQKEFIINCVSISIRDTLESESEYKKKIKEMADKNKSIMSYTDLYNTALLYYTFGMFLIAIQTSIPSIKTRKTFPGCVKSFEGFPFEGTGDYSSLHYVACIAYNNRLPYEPWDVLKKKKEAVIADKIKSVINEVLMNLPDVKRKFDEKTDYLLIHPVEEIPPEHNILNWTEFLPPLNVFKIQKLSNISEEFKHGLMKDLRSGSSNQREKILVIDSKIIQFSLAIQEKIQNIVNKKHLLLLKNSNEPYLENACCDSKEGESTIQYFTNEDSGIMEYNTIVQRLTNILADITSYTKGGLFFSNIDTKNKYPSISQDFSEKTIYLAFIYFCKFKSLMPIPENLLPLCTDKPNENLINENDTIDEIIIKLKDNGRSYKTETFLRLIQLIGRNNIVDIDIETPVISSIGKLNGILESINPKKEEVVEEEFIKLMTNALDTFDIATETVTSETTALLNFVTTQIGTMKEDIIDFIEKNKGSDVTKQAIKKMTTTMNRLSDWSVDNSSRNENIKISSDGMYNIVNFYKTFITNFASVFPNIILNKVDYKNTLIPQYVGLSVNHAKKIKGFINDYYEKLRIFYETPKIYNVLTTVQKSCENMVHLSNGTPCFSTIKTGKRELKPVFDERTSRLLYDYYLLRIFMRYIDLTDKDEMLVVQDEVEVQEIDIFSVEYLEDQATRVDTVASTRTVYDTQILNGNKKGLRQKIAKLLIVFIEIMDDHKDVIDISYEEILDRVFKLREREKDIVTDRLKVLTDEERDADTILKINKLGVWSKGLQKGLTSYVKETYDDEREFRDEMEKTEKKIRMKNKNATDDNMDQLVEDYLEQTDVDADIEREENDMSRFTDDYQDGNFDGDEVENSDDYE